MLRERSIAPYGWDVHCTAEVGEGEEGEEKRGKTKSIYVSLQIFIMDKETSFTFTCMRLTVLLQFSFKATL